MNSQLNSKRGPEVSPMNGPELASDHPDGNIQQLGELVRSSVTEATHLPPEHKSIEAAEETNEHGVSMETIKNFVNGLKLRFRFRVADKTVLERLQATLTIEKLNNLLYFQNHGHELDVTGITPEGKFVFSTCTSRPLVGEHRGVTYSQALNFATVNGAKLMTYEYYKELKMINSMFGDFTTRSWVDTPSKISQKEVTKSAFSRFITRINSIVGNLTSRPSPSDSVVQEQTGAVAFFAHKRILQQRNADDSKDDIGFRITILV